MAVSNFIKQNFALVLGIALPVLLVAGFMMMAAAPQSKGPAPQYALLFTVQEGHGGNIDYNVDYVVKEDRLYARLTARRENDYSRSYNELYRFDGKSGSVKKITPDLPESIGDEKQRDIEVAAFSGTRLSADSKSPDGFTLENGRYRSRGITGVFFGGSHGYQNVLRHEKGYAYKVPEYAGTYSYSHLKFIGWIISEKS